MTLNLTAAPTLPSLNDPASFNSRALTLFDWLVNTFIGELEAIQAADYFSVQTSPTDTTAGRLLAVGAFGLGTSSPADLADLNDALVVGVRRFAASATNRPSFFSDGGMVITTAQASNRRQQIAIEHTTGTMAKRFISDVVPSSGVWTAWVKFWDTGNTVVDGSGFVKQASPVLRVADDGITAPVKEIAGAALTKIGLGHYLLTGTPPLATEGWAVQAPSDESGRRIADVGTPRWTAAGLHLRTYDPAGRPADIPSGAHVLLRFWDAEGNGDTAPAVPVLPDEEADAAALADERTRMAAYRLAFEDACAQSAYGAGTLLEAVDAALQAVSASERRRYQNITIFERLRPEIGAFLQSPAGINLTDAQIDDLFRLAMQIEAG